MTWLTVDVLNNHPSYELLRRGNGLFHDPSTGGPAVQNLWSSEEGTSKDGSWVDLTAEVSRKWWSQGIRELVRLGVDGIWE